MRKALIAGLAALVVAAVVVGLSQTETTTEAPVSAALSTEQIAERLRGAPAPLAAVHAQANDLLGGERTAVRERLEALKGHPVVVNKWASWCGPCRAEFPHFQSLSVELGKEVAFLGLNSGDNRGDAMEFLEEFPVSFPSFTDPNEKVALDLGASAAYPVTIFYDASGEKTHVKQGQYATEAALRADIERYARGRGA